MTMADIVARMERSEIRGRRRVIPGLRCAPSGLRSLRVRPNLLKRINKRTRGCGCHGHPAFPTPSLVASRGRERVFRRHCERSEAIHPSLRGKMDCFAALAMTAGALDCSRSLSSGAHSRDPLARNDVEVAAPYMRDATQANVAPTLPSPDNSITTLSPALSHTVLTRLPVSTNSPARRALPSEAR